MDTPLKDTPLNQRPTDSQAMLNFAKATPQQSNLDDTPGKQQPISTALRPTRSHCNTLIPIARLPFDIMARIFADILHALRWNMPEVVALATVCQDWYSTMLDAPYLWSHIDFDQPEFVQPFIQRSCNSPLHILDRGPRMSIMDICISFSPTGPAYSKPTPPSMIDLEPYTHRIQTLDLSLTSSCLQHLLKIIRLSPILPQLKQLRITHRQNRDRDAQLHINAMALDTRITSPFLDTMILTDMIWHASSYANLRKLSLTFNNTQFTSSQVLDYVNSILTQSPRLQDLCVRFWNHPRGQTKSHLPTLSLPLLKNLVLSGHHLLTQLYEAIDAPISHLQMTALNLQMHGDAIYSKISTSSRCQHCEFSLLVFNEYWEMLPVSCQCLHLRSFFVHSVTTSKLSQIRQAAPNFFITQLVVCLRGDLQGEEQDWLTLLEALPSLRRLHFDAKTSVCRLRGFGQDRELGYSLIRDGPVLEKFTRAAVALFNRGTKLVPNLSHFSIHYYFTFDASGPLFFDVGHHGGLDGFKVPWRAVNCFAVDWAVGSTIRCEQLDLDKTSVRTPTADNGEDRSPEFMSSIQNTWKALVPGVDITYVDSLPHRNQHNELYDDVFSSELLC